MADKVNMSLDDIIKANKIRKPVAGGNRTTANKKQGARLSTGRGRASAFTAKKIVKKAVANQRNKARRSVGGAGPSSNSGMIPRSEVKNLVNKAVKQAMRQSNVSVGIAGRLGGGKMPRNIITATKLAQLSQRSRTIQRNPRVNAIRGNRFAQRGRNFGNRPVQVVEEVVAPRTVVRQRVQAPVVQVIERIREVPVPVTRQPIRRIGGRPVVARQQQQIARVGGGRVIRQQPVIVRQPAQRIVQRPVQRVIQRPAQRVIQRPAQSIIQRPAQQIVYEQRPAPRVQIVRQAPQRVQVVRQAPQRVQVVRQAPQRVQVIRQAPIQRRNNNGRQNVQYVEYAPTQAARKNNRMREALGLGNPRHVTRDATRFEPSSSFLANRTVTSRGRGFNGRNAY